MEAMIIVSVRALSDVNVAFSTSLSRLSFSSPEAHEYAEYSDTEGWNI